MLGGGRLWEIHADSGFLPGWVAVQWCVCVCVCVCGCVCVWGDEVFKFNLIERPDQRGLHLAAKSHMVHGKGRSLVWHNCKWSFNECALYTCASHLLHLKIGRRKGACRLTACWSNSVCVNVQKSHSLHRKARSLFDWLCFTAIDKSRNGVSLKTHHYKSSLWCQLEIIAYYHKHWNLIITLILGSIVISVL